MKRKIVLMLLVLIGLGCKQNRETQNSEPVDTNLETETISDVSPITKELIEFADLVVTDSTDVNELIVFKEIDSSGSINEINSTKAIALYKKMTKRQEVTSLPIFELKNKNTTILLIKGVGFGGAIWAKVLVDRTTLEIKDIAFEHQAESEGYGAAMTQSSFENQFVGAKIDFDQHTYTLQRNIEKRMDNGTIINGISGATITNQGVIEMMNQGLQPYKRYLKP